MSFIVWCELRGDSTGRRNTSTKGLSRPTSWTLKKKVIVGSDLISRPMKYFGRSIVLSSPICMSTIYEKRGVWSVTEKVGRRLNCC